MAVVVYNKHEHGDTVYLKTDPDQLPRIVSCIRVYMNGELMYDLICGTISSVHYDFEISKTKDFVNAI